MTQQLKYAYKSVFPGWWPILDKYIPQMIALDPNCTLLVKEKYGTLRIRPYKITNGSSWEAFYDIANEAELESAQICEFCGKPGRLHEEDYWCKTMCDFCAAKDPSERLKMRVID